MTIILVLFVLVLLGMMAGCNTVGGVGQDLMWMSEKYRSEATNENHGRFDAMPEVQETLYCWAGRAGY